MRKPETLQRQLAGFPPPDPGTGVGRLTKNVLQAAIPPP